MELVVYEDEALWWDLYRLAKNSKREFILGYPVYSYTMHLLMVFVSSNAILCKLRSSGN